MSKDPLAEQSLAMLRALDFGSQVEDMKARHRDELRRLLLSLLDVVDAFDRLLAATAAGDGREDGWRRSVRLIAGQLEKSLAEADVHPIDCLGEVVDPHRHEIAETRETTAADDDVIVAVDSRGWQWREGLLRRPRVVVARNPVAKDSVAKDSFAKKNLKEDEA